MFVRIVPHQPVTLVQIFEKPVLNAFQRFDSIVWAVLTIAFQAADIPFPITDSSADIVPQMPFHMLTTASQRDCSACFPNSMAPFQSPFMSATTIPTTFTITLRIFPTALSSGAIPEMIFVMLVRTNAATDSITGTM